MGLLSPLRNLRRRSKRNIRVTGMDTLPPDVRAAMQARANHLRMHGRPHGELAKRVGEEVMAAGHAWPKVLEDERLGTTTVPATFEGLLAMVASWDSILLDEELQVLRNLTNEMMPAGTIAQDNIRRRRAQELAEQAHMREHHADERDAGQGWRV